MLHELLAGRRIRIYSHPVEAQRQQVLHQRLVCPPMLQHLRRINPLYKSLQLCHSNKPS